MNSETENMFTVNLTVKVSKWHVAIPTHRTVQKVKMVKENQTYKCWIQMPYEQNNNR